MKIRQTDTVTGIVVDEFGDWRHARIGTLPLRPLRKEEILIECEAAALNFQDLLMIEGKYQDKPPLPFIPGSDVAGRIVALGEGVTRFKAGQRVAALVQPGAFADYAIARVGRCFPIPDEIGSADAAAATSVFATVVVALELRAQLRSGERILITGAAGGVGTAAIQYSRDMGAQVIALVSSEAKQQVAQQAGAQHIVRLDRLTNPKQDIRPALTALGIDGVDVVLDMVSGDVFDGTIRCLVPGGRMIVVGFASGRIAQARTNYILLKGISVIGSALKIGLEQDGDRVAHLMDRVYRDIASGRINTFIAATYPLTEFARAAEMIAARSATGKFVLTPSPKVVSCRGD